MIDFSEFTSISVGLSSPDTIRSWSSGEVKKPETINYRTQRPERDGLFCERIFGPTKDWECYCGKYKRERFKGIICDKCGVEITRSKVRRERMGHVELATPVSHIWYFKGTPGKMGLALDLSPKVLEKVIYFASYIVIFVDEKQRKKKSQDIEKIIEENIERLKQNKEKQIQQIQENYLEKTKELMSKREIDDIEKKKNQEIQSIEYTINNNISELEEGEKLLFSLNKMDILSEKEVRCFNTVRDLLVDRKIWNEKEPILKISIGAEAILQLLKEIDLEKTAKELRQELPSASLQKKIKIVKRLETIEAFIKSGNRPAWMIFEVLPVIPPDLRPMVQLAGGRFATSDLNDLYRRVINRNNRLKRLYELGAPEVIIRNEKRMLQEAVDALIDNGRRGRPVCGSTGRPLKSLSDLLKGKQGRFRQNLLGKRVDYSGRSVIVVGPKLKLYQCGLPKEMALELFKPFIMKKLVDKGYVNNIKVAKRFIERQRPEIWDILEEVIKGHPVLLNRAPTLHRLGIQAFEPILVEGKAIQIHPLVCSPFNADFDGDQMAVHVPISLYAQLESRILMLSAHNLLSPANGKPVSTPTQDMVLGCYYLTLENLFDNRIIKLDIEENNITNSIIAENIREPNTKEIIVKTGTKITEGTIKILKKYGYKAIKIFDVKTYSDFDEVVLAYDHKETKLHAKIRVRIPGNFLYSYSEREKVIYCKSYLFVESDIIGKTIVKDVFHPVTNKIIAKQGDIINEKTIKNIEASEVRNLFLKDEETKEIIRVSTEYLETTVGRVIFNLALPQELQFLDRVIDKKEIIRIVEESYRKLGITKTVLLLDALKDFGFKFATLSGLTIGIDDLQIPLEKDEILRRSEKEVEKINELCDRGIITDTERYQKTIEVWTRATHEITNFLLQKLEKFNPLLMMSDSGARGATQQLRQLSAMRGLTIDPSGKIIDLPIKSSFKEGLTVLEYFLSTHGGRKGLVDTALRTAKAGYLTRRLIDVAQDVIIREEDCKTKAGIVYSAIYDGGELLESLQERIIGRIAAENIVNPETQEIIVKSQEEITEDVAQRIIAANIQEVKLRSVLTCKSRYGVCAKCYGRNLATGRRVEIGEAVGIIAAQSIGEPGTQMTLRTFHTGGMLVGMDITQGLPRAEELFEVRKPKITAIISEIDGELRITTDNKLEKIIVRGSGREKVYDLSPGDILRVKNGDRVSAGEPLTEGSINPHDILRVKGLQYAQKFLLEEIQKVYKPQGVDINDKHIEIIIRQLSRRARVEDIGETDLLPGQIIDIFEFQEKNENAKAKKKKPAKATPVLLGITKAALAIDSFLSAASFQETTRVLTESAIEGKEDLLLGLKENVIIGKLIPAGTGNIRYKNIHPICEIE